MSIYTETTYCRDGATHQAVVIANWEVEAILGGPYEGTAKHDARLRAELRNAGAPAWVGEAESWQDERQWGLIGPQIPPDLDNIIWHVPPVCQGQIVERAFGLDSIGMIWERRTDHSDRSVTYNEVCAVGETEGPFEPWDRIPTVSR